VDTGATTAQGQRGTKEGRIAVPLELRVFGPLPAGMRVEATPAGFINNVDPIGNGSATVSFVVQNTGNIRLAGSQVVSVTGPFGMKAIVRPKVLATILPGDSVVFTATAHALYPAGPLPARVQVTPGPPRGEPVLAAQL